MPMRQLRVEYKEFEAKNQLFNRVDKVLVDDRIIRLIPQFLGGIFYKKKKFPVPVKLTKKNLQDEINRCINTVVMPLNNHGSCATCPVGKKTG
ncbi:ribosomal L1 domain-containing protein 1 [Eurytemora carolleeae]|uniref:ribosomal L1 domain-containing protein 1 n=1 Tax=Eurytemora carolleeae TaxID=1294199 RepID=UPI000C767C8D|nr:ribosomal L1 domain-containing protein 1 [Eurytemora carolleeae]|eukprot:XP_023336373.1 ribosomal L1 domain-containing protein 1-like [Eurytemora affinis]